MRAELVNDCDGKKSAMRLKPDRKDLRLAARLGVLMAAGAFLGDPIIGEWLVAYRFGYRHNLMQGVECDFAGAFIGAGLGLFLHLLLDALLPKLSALEKRMSGRV